MGPVRDVALPPLGAALVGAALALHAAALWRTQVLLTGSSVTVAALLAALTVALVLIGRRRRPMPVGLGVALGLVATFALGAVAAPVAMQRLPPSLASLAAVPFFAAIALALRAVPERPLLPGIAGASAGALLAALALPFLGPLLASLLALVLALAGALLTRPPRARGEEPPTTEVIPPTPLAARWAALLAGVGLAHASLVLVGGGTHPWPSGPARAAFLAAGIALGLALTSRARSRSAQRATGLLGLACVGLLLVPGVRGAIDSITAFVATREALPAIGPLGGALTLLVGAALAGLVPGLGAGLASAGLPRGTALGTGAGAFVAGVLVLSSLTRLEVVSADEPSRERRGTWNGHVVEWSSARRKPDDLFGAHVGALLAKGRTRAVVLGWGSPDAVAALKLHGFEVVREAGPVARKSHALGSPAHGTTSPEVRSPRQLRRVGPCDVILSELEDPTLREHEALFTREGLEAARDALAPGGVFVQRLSLERLGPDDLLRHVLLVLETFPDTWLMSSDLGRGGSVFAVALGRDEPVPHRAPVAGTERASSATASQAAGPGDPAPAAGGAEAEPGPPRVGVVVPPAPPGEAAPRGARRLPSWTRLTGADRMSPEIAASLREARLLNLDDLLGTFVAGPEEIEALRGTLGPHDAWIPGGLAFRHPAPGDVARDLAQALLFGRLAKVDVRFENQPRAIPGEHPQRWDFIGVDARLGTEWVPGEAVLRHANRLGRVFDQLAVSRTSARRMVFTAPGQRLEIRSARVAEAPREVLAAALAELEGDALNRSGGASVHGHAGLWMFEQLGTERQEVALAWHCPLRGVLYTAELQRWERVKPGLYEELLSVLVDDIRCIHEDAPPRGVSRPEGPR